MTGREGVQETATFPCPEPRSCPCPAPGTLGPQGPGHKRYHVDEDHEAQGMENRPGPRSSLASGHSPYLILHPHFFWVTSLLALPSLVSRGSQLGLWSLLPPTTPSPSAPLWGSSVLSVAGPCLPPGGVWAQGHGEFVGGATDGPVLGHEGEWARGQVGGWQLPSSTKSLMLELRVITQHQDIVGEDGPSRPGHVIATSSGVSPALGTPDRLSPFRGQEAGLSLRPPA